jgi:hypothetical protein
MTRTILLAIAIAAMLGTAHAEELVVCRGVYTAGSCVGSQSYLDSDQDASRAFRRTRNATRRAHSRAASPTTPTPTERHHVMPIIPATAVT